MYICSSELGTWQFLVNKHESESVVGSHSLSLSFLALSPSLVCSPIDDVFGLQRESFNMHIKRLCSYIITVIKTKKKIIILFTLLPSHAALPSLSSIVCCPLRKSDSRTHAVESDVCG